MDISFKIHSPWSIGRKAAEIGTVNEFSSMGSILGFHSFVMLGGFAQADTSDPDSTIKTEAATKAAARYEFIEILHPRGSNLARVDAQQSLEICRDWGDDERYVIDRNCDRRPFAKQPRSSRCVFSQSAPQ
ncbi:MULTISPECIES: hypothetical protein [Rhizobium]|uniref:hypothetical protein n=1 Tax=Rhizobium TaxID=379 RepID=UPI00103F601C|nr:hypothetical protein [Rhizobium leguminosarum]NKL99053.1 hypothetical protein [Rhizobium leguminosarum bv. viciae]TCA06707.1 hypothetical protein E0H57_11810 [Rhizobium leguminosarum bv. viciae]UFW76397.1 hypothetical protein RlegSU303_14095 [Rhizobium leguminosarum bv. viciae]